MPQLYLMRHAHALSVQESTIRPLSEQGIQSAHKIAQFLQQNAIAINTIFHSNVERAIQTANIVAETLKLEHTLTYLPFLDPESNVELLGSMIGQLGPNALLIGHLPNLELLSNFLLTYDYQHPTISYQPGAIAAFNLSDNTCILDWFIQPGLV